MNICSDVVVVDDDEKEPGDRESVGFGLEITIERCCGRLTGGDLNDLGGMKHATHGPAAKALLVIVEPGNRIVKRRITVPATAAFAVAEESRGLVRLLLDFILGLSNALFTWW
jgi:hypothetical protein